MIATVSNVHAGYIRGYLPTPILRELLLGNRSFRSALEAGGNDQARSVHHSQVQAGTLVGFILDLDSHREVIVAELPFKEQIVPAVLLSATGGDWEAEPQLISKERLTRFEGIIVRADWLSHLIALAKTLKNPNTHLLGVDNTLRAIGTAWERWESTEMSWCDRCKDLARLTRLPKLGPNTLMQKCKRHGLVRRDNKAPQCQRHARASN